MSDAYRVLARKYRPQTFDDLIGQEALVQTLRGAITRGRIAQAYMLTGVRGVGKTTTARIIAKALNCVGADGSNDEPTINPCGVCEQCQAIADDRHMDVLEMDAASRTGVDDMRELIESVAYRPGIARRKVYIIDEVHMLSKSAFNALLKTLEEPPPHVLFVFATTDIHKVPVTILSRCQRFDLRRVSAETLARHLAAIAVKEEATLPADAAMLLARAAAGSVRDSLSLLDQAIALAEGGQVDAPLVQSMLGLVARSDSLDLLQALLDGDAAALLESAATIYSKGADPQAMLEDVLSFLHTLCRLQMAPALPWQGAADEEQPLRALADKAQPGQVMSLWQMATAGMQEVRSADRPFEALEMVLLRLSYARQLPDPGDLLAMLENGSAAVPMQGGAQANALSGGQAPLLRSFEDIVALATQRRRGALSYQLRHFARLVKFQDMALELALEEGASPTLTADVAKFLQEATGQRWMVGLSKDAAAGLPTLAAQQQEADRVETERLAQHPLVAEALRLFPESKIINK